MTGKQGHHDQRNHDGDQERLAQLYREMGDIEPGPGVDQRIRAQARDQVHPGRLARPAQWLGGAAVAASLVLVVSIVVDIEPPGPEMPPGDGRAASDSAPVRQEADRAEASSFSAEPPRRAAREAEPPAVMERAAPALSAPASAPAMERRERQSAADDAARKAHEQYEALGANRQTEEGRADAREMLRPAEEQELELLGADMTEPDEALWLIERLIAVGNAQRARAEVEGFRESYPDREVPAQLLARLEALEAADAPE